MPALDDILSTQEDRDAWAQMGGTTDAAITQAIRQGRQVPGNWNNQRVRDYFAALRMRDIMDRTASEDSRLGINRRLSNQPFDAGLFPGQPNASYINSPDLGGMRRLQRFDANGMVAGADYTANFDPNNAYLGRRNPEGPDADGVQPGMLVNERGQQELATDFRARMDAWRQKDAQLAERTADATMTNAVSRIRQATIDNGNMLPSAMDMAATDLAEKKRLSAEQYNEWQNTRFMRAMSGWRNRGNLMKFQEQVADMQYRNAMRQEHVGRSIRSMAETLVDVEGNIDTKALESLRPQVAAMAQSGGLDIISGMTLLNTATKRASNEARFRTFRQKQIDDTLKTERELRTDLIRQQIENAKKPDKAEAPITRKMTDQTSGAEVDVQWKNDRWERTGPYREVPDTTGWNPTQIKSALAGGVLTEAEALAAMKRLMASAATTASPQPTPTRTKPRRQPNYEIPLDRAVRQIPGAGTVIDAIGDAGQWLVTPWPDE